MNEKKLGVNHFFLWVEFFRYVKNSYFTEENSLPDCVYNFKQLIIIMVYHLYMNLYSQTSNTK